MGVEMAAAQSSRTVEEVWAHSQMAEEDRAMLTEKSWREGVRATCPSCNAPLVKNVKFCPECGAKIQPAAHCSECGAKLEPGAKFCAECGAKVG
jgi:predicted amidophosphoribosyltransferase